MVLSKDRYVKFLVKGSQAQIVKKKRKWPKYVKVE